METKQLTINALGAISCFVVVLAIWGVFSFGLQTLLSSIKTFHFQTFHFCTKMMVSDHFFWEASQDVDSAAKFSCLYWDPQILRIFVLFQIFILLSSPAISVCQISIPPNFWWIFVDFFWKHPKICFGARRQKMSKKLEGGQVGGVPDSPAPWGRGLPDDPPSVPLLRHPWCMNARTHARTHKSTQNQTERCPRCECARLWLEV